MVDLNKPTRKLLDWERPKLFGGLCREALSHSGARWHRVWQLAPPPLRCVLIWWKRRCGRELTSVTALGRPHRAVRHLTWWGWWPSDGDPELHPRAVSLPRSGRGVPTAGITAQAPGALQLTRAGAWNGWGGGPGRGGHRYITCHLPSLCLNVSGSWPGKSILHWFISNEKVQRLNG